MAETWIINEIPRNIRDGSVQYDISGVCGGKNFDGLRLDRLREYDPILEDFIYHTRIIMSLGTDQTRIYDNSWFNDFDMPTTYELTPYKTITFETAPTGELLTWLQSDAVKQQSNITLDLSTIDLPVGSHIIQMKLSDDGVTKADSEFSNSVTYTVEPEPTGETWVINESPNLSGSGLIDVSINFTSNSNNYSRIGIYRGSGPSRELQYDTYAVWGPWGWEDTAYRTVTFSTSPTGDLLTWLQANAVKQ